MYLFSFLRSQCGAVLTLSSFYGFPEHYYKEKFPNKGSPQLASEIIELLGQAGIKSQGMRRGPDHGVWASFKVGMYKTVCYQT